MRLLYICVCVCVGVRMVSGGRSMQILYFSKSTNTLLSILHYMSKSQRSTKVLTAKSTASVKSQSNHCADSWPLRVYMIIFIHVTFLDDIVASSCVYCKNKALITFSKNI